MTPFHISNEELEDILRALAPAIEKYRAIQARVYACDVSRDREFQRLFNGFYRVRRSRERWQGHFYRVFEDAKKMRPTFEGVLNRMYDATGRVEASFVSKLIATLDPQSPVIDAHVLRNFGLALPPTTCKGAARIAAVVDVYDRVCAQYLRLLASPEAVHICARFTHHYPDAVQDVTDLKKLDLVLWQVRG